MEPLFSTSQRPSESTLHLLCRENGDCKTAAMQIMAAVFCGISALQARLCFKTVFSVCPQTPPYRRRSDCPNARINRRKNKGADNRTCRPAPLAEPRAAAQMPRLFHPSKSVNQEKNPAKSKISRGWWT